MRSSTGVRERIDAARGIAEHAPRSWETLRDWWTGNAVETACEHLPTAREDLFMFAPAASVRAQLPSIQRRLAKVSPDPAHDPQLAGVREIASTSGALSLDQREGIRTAHEHVRVVEDDHSEGRGFRNNLLLWSAGPTAVAIVLAAIQDSGFDYLAVGAGAGMLTTALAWRNLTHVEGPYAVSTAEALLKIPAGAASALLGVVLVRSGVISGLNVERIDGVWLCGGLRAVVTGADTGRRQRRQEDRCLDDGLHARYASLSRDAAALLARAID
jgi:hypothetical protein